MSIVNYNRHILFDEYIKPELKVSNYLHHVTNLDSFKIGRAMGLSYYQDKIKKLLKNKKIIGHTLDVDIKALGLENIDANLRDISEFSLFKRGKYKESLKNLTDKYL